MYMTFKKWSNLIALGLLAGSTASATQTVEHSDRKPVQVSISVSESNRLAVEGRKIAKVVPAQPGVIGAEKDEVQGVLYFTLKPGRAGSMGTVTMFVTDDQGGSYTLTLVPRPIPGEDIIIRPAGDKAAAERKSSGADGKATSYQRRIKDLILLMADEDMPGSQADRIDVNLEVALWKEGRLTLVSKFLGTDLVGEKYRLANVSSSAMLLAEQELYRHGVRAVSVKNQTLAPGDATEIYIVRERKEHE